MFHHVARFRTQPHQAAQDLKNWHADPARDWREVSRAAQIGDENSFQQTPHHQAETQSQKNVCWEEKMDHSQTQ